MMRKTLLLLSLFLSWPVAAQEAQPAPAAPTSLNGTWVLNLELSDDPDKLIEKTVRKAGGRISSDKSGRERYRGGPPEQEIYDHLAYDKVLTIQQSNPEYTFTYDQDSFTRVFHSDGRSRVVSASGAQAEGRAGFAFASWDGAILRVEARPPDGGWTKEVYTIDPVTGQLHAELVLKPLQFVAPLTLFLVFDRKN